MKASLLLYGGAQTALFSRKISFSWLTVLITKAHAIGAYAGYG